MLRARPRPLRRLRPLPFPARPGRPPSPCLRCVPLPCHRSSGGPPKPVRRRGQPRRPRAMRCDRRAGLLFLGSSRLNPEVVLDSGDDLRVVVHCNTSLSSLRSSALASRGREVGERCPPENLDCRVPDLDPYLAERRIDNRRAWLGITSSRIADRRKLPLEQSNDAFEGDVSRSVVQTVPTVRTALGTNDAGRAKCRHYLLEDGPGCTRSCRDLVQFQPTVGHRQGEDGSSAIVGSLRDPHGWWCVHCRLTTPAPLRNLLPSNCRQCLQVL